MAGAPEHVDARTRKKEAKDRKLDEALKETFPASDPVSTGCPTGREKPKTRVDRKPPKLPK